MQSSDALRTCTCAAEVAGVTFSDTDSASVQTFLNPDLVLKSFQIRAADFNVLCA